MQFEKKTLPTANDKTEIPRYSVLWNMLRKVQQSESKMHVLLGLILNSDVTLHSEAPVLNLNATI